MLSIGTVSIFVAKSKSHTLFVTNQIIIMSHLISSFSTYLAILRFQYKTAVAICHKIINIIRLQNTNFLPFYKGIFLHHHLIYRFQQFFILILPH